MGKNQLKNCSVGYKLTSVSSPTPLARCQETATILPENKAHAFRLEVAVPLRAC